MPLDRTYPCLLGELFGFRARTAQADGDGKYHGCMTPVQPAERRLVSSPAECFDKCVVVVAH